MSGRRLDGATPAEASAEADVPLRWRRTPVAALGATGAVVLAAAGAALSRPDLVAVGLPLALSAAWALLRRPRADRFSVMLRAGTAGEAVGGAVTVTGDVERVQIAIDQSDRRTGLADAAPGVDIVRTRSVLNHSGPVALLSTTVRALTADGAWIADPVAGGRIVWNTAPRTIPLGELPLPPRLLGLHGSHEGSRPGQGGEFRDIHAFAPGDELRRVDWRATARAARRPGDLLIRRTNALAEGSVVIALDTAEDLGQVVATWGRADPEHSGPTTLDLGREAALSLAAAAVAAGDRVAFHALAPGGRSVRSGSGPRHLARLRGVIAATGVGGDGSRFRRTPPVPTGSIVFVLSTFFDGAAAEVAARWRAAGHAVVAVDILPLPDADRLTPEQTVALRALLVERREVLADLRHAGVGVVEWGGGADDVQLRAMARDARMSGRTGVRR